MLRIGQRKVDHFRGIALAAITLAAAIAAAPAAAQRGGGSSLVDRLNALRNSWSGSLTDATDAANEPEAGGPFSGGALAEDLPPAPTPPPVPTPLTPVMPRSITAVAEDEKPAASPKAYPRMNPRDLLPRRWFGTTPIARPEPTSADAASDGSPTASTGSTRERLLRQNRAASGAPRVAARPAPRAGSVLSGDSQPTGTDQPATPRTNSRLTRSIAAEVAETLLDPVKRETQPPATADSVVAEAAAKRPTPAEPTPAEPTLAAHTPAPAAATPAEPPVEAEPPRAPPAGAVAESDAGRVRVAAKPGPTTTLPMFIGDRYSSIEAETGSAEALDAPSDRAAGAFARGPDAQPVVEPSVARSADAEDLLLTQQMPVLVSKVAGPRQIVVGREATYRVLLANRGDIAADAVVTSVAAPEWAEVVSVEAADGVVDRASAGSGGAISWRNATLDAGQVATLTLRIVAREGRPIELAVAHRHRPIDGRTLVEVQEPKLDLAMVGPEEVLYGKPQLFRLTISNPGTGVAENVVLHLTPPGGDAARRTSHEFGELAPGEDRAVEIELTAREAGQLLVNAAASADGGVEAETTKNVFCRKAELVVDWRGPSERYAGAPATYYLRVRNPGTATAPDVVLSVELPDGFEVTPAAGTPRVESGRLAYRVGSLRAGDDRYFELRGVMRRGGENELGIRAAASDETRSAPVSAKTSVIALADLKLDVLDPKGPIATGEEVEYEIRVTNRGSNEARDVAIIGLFSDGIEPHHIDGADATIDDGRVELAVIPTMAAGEDRVFKIRARAHEPGTHLFRAEVLCTDLEIKLAAEETTRFFEDETINVAGEGPRTGSRYLLTY